MRSAVHRTITCGLPGGDHHEYAQKEMPSTTQAYAQYPRLARRLVDGQTEQDLIWIQVVSIPCHFDDIV